MWIRDRDRTNQRKVMHMSSDNPVVFGCVFHQGRRLENCFAEKERNCGHYRTTRLFEREGGTSKHQSPHCILTREFIGFAQVPVR